MVGTDAHGVFELRDGTWSPVRGLEHQWVTPHGLKSLDGALWVGGLGMPASAGGAALEVPARDTFDVVATPSEIFVLTSQGVMTMPRLATASVPQGAGAGPRRDKKPSMSFWGPPRFFACVSNSTARAASVAA